MNNTVESSSLFLERTPFWQQTADFNVIVGYFQLKDLVLRGTTGPNINRSVVLKGATPYICLFLYHIVYVPNKVFQTV